MLGVEQHDEGRPPPPNPDRDPPRGPAPDRRRGVRWDRRLHRHLARGPAGCPAGAGPALPERGGNFLCPFLLRIPDDRSDAHGCRPPVVGLVGSPRGPLRLPDGDPESGPSARRGPHGRLADRFLHSPRPGGDEVRRRNLETRRVGWSRFTVTPTTADETSFARLAELTRKLEATTKRLEKRALLATFLRSLRRDEGAPAVHLIVGRIFAESDARALNVGWATLQKAVGRAKQASLVPRTLSILEVSRTFAQIAETHGADSTRVRRRLLESLLGRASEDERDVLLKNVFGEMRIGVNEGVMLEGIADASGVDLDTVRTAHMFLGDLGMIAEIALFEGADGLRSRGLRRLAPMKPMLAEMSEDLDEVLAVHGGMTAIEYKLDGARIQIHRKGEAVKIFSRRLSDVTSSLPEIVAIAKSLPAPEFLLEGEVVAVNKNGKPLPFQDLMRRFRRVHGIESAAEEIPLKLYLFDVLHLDGRTLIDAPYRERWEILERLVPAELLTARRIAQRKDEIESFLQEALVAGHEGLMAKQLESTYSVGKRGKKWFKIKPADHLDLAITAAEWGSGRREGWLSNYWLAVRDDKGGGFQMIGKTVKGLTDAEFQAMTERSIPLGRGIFRVPSRGGERSLHVPRGDDLRSAAGLAEGRQVDAEEGQTRADRHPDRRHLGEQDPGQETRSDRLSDEAQAHDGRGHPPQRPVVQSVSANLRDDRQGREQEELPGHVPQGREARPECERVHKEDRRGARIDDKRVIQQGDALPHPSAEEEVEPGHHTAAEGEDVRIEEAPRESVVGEGDRHDAGEAEDDSDGHPPVQALAQDVVREEADHQRMGRDQHDRRRDGLPLDLQRGDPQRKVGREDPANKSHDGRVAPRNAEECVLVAKDAAAHEDRHADDQRGGRQRV